MSAELPRSHSTPSARPHDGRSPARHETADVCSLAFVVAVALALLLLVVAQRGPDSARAASGIQQDGEPRLIGPPVRQVEATRQER